MCKIPSSLQAEFEASFRHKVVSHNVLASDVKGALSSREISFSAADGKAITVSPKLMAVVFSRVETSGW